jgi:hypothetical protein
MAFLQAEVAWTTIALTATTAKSVGGLKAPSNQVVKILEVSASHDGSTSSNAPDVTDIGRCTFATNAPGTNSTSYTPGKKDPGRGETVQTTAATNWTTEPTVITVFRSINLAQYNGLYHYISPFANPFVVIGGQGLVLRQNSPNNCNSSGTIEFEE